MGQGFLKRIGILVALMVTILLIGGPLGCSKKKDRNRSGQRTFANPNPNGLIPIPGHGTITGSGKTPLPAHRDSNAVHNPNLQAALDVLVLHGGEVGEAVMKGIVADLEAGLLKVRFTGEGSARFMAPEKAGAMIDVCLDDFQQTVEDEGQIDFETFKACHKPLFVRMRTLNGFGKLQRGKLGRGTQASLEAFAHVLAGQWILSLSWREDKLLFANQPKVFRAIFAGDDLAWEKGLGVDEAHARTLRSLYFFYQRVQVFKISMKLAKTGMPHPLLSTILGDQEQTVHYINRKLEEQEALGFGPNLGNRVYQVAYSTKNFEEFMKAARSGGEDSVFRKALEHITTEWGIEPETSSEN